jgi:hypothetical protein
VKNYYVYMLASKRIGRASGGGGVNGEDSLNVISMTYTRNAIGEWLRGNQIWEF